MKRSMNRTMVVRKNRLKRRSRRIVRDVLLAVAIISAAGFFGMVMVYGYNFVLCSDFFTVRDVTITGNDRVADAEVLGLANLSGDTNILTANLPAMASRIKADPWVREVRMQRRLPDRLVIEITERRPVALVHHETTLYLLDEEGTVFKNMDHDDRVDLPVLTGFSDGGSLDEDLLPGALDLLRYLSERRGYPELEHVSEIRGSTLAGYSLCTNDRRLYLLGRGDYDEKFRRLRKVLFDLSARQASLSPLIVDMSDPDRVVVRPGSLAGPESVRKRTEI